MSFWSRSVVLTFVARVDVIVDDGWRLEQIDGANYLVRGDDLDDRDEVLLEAEQVLMSFSPDATNSGWCTVYGDPPWRVRVTPAKGVES